MDYGLASVVDGEGMYVEWRGGQGWWMRDGGRVIGVVETEKGAGWVVKALSLMVCVCVGGGCGGGGGVVGGGGGGGGGLTDW